MSLTKEKKQNLLERIGGSYKDAFEAGHALFDYLKELPYEDQVIAFEEILVKFGHPETKRSGKQYNLPGLSEEATQRLKIGLGKLIDGNFQYCLAKRPDSSELAQHMWKLISALETDEEKIFSLGWLIADSIVPYIQIPQGGVRLNEDTHKAIVDQLRPKLRVIEKILRWPALSDTERMSLCLGVIMDKTTDEEQAVLMQSLVAQVADIVRKQNR